MSQIKQFWDKLKEKNNQSKKTTKYIYYAFAAIIAINLVVLLLPPSLPECSDSDTKELAIELIMEHSLPEGLRAYAGDEAMNLWEIEGAQHLDLIKTDLDYSTENSNYCTARFNARTMIPGSQPPQLSKTTEPLANVEYEVALTDEGGWYVQIYDVQW